MMVSIPNFLRREAAVLDEVGIDIHVMNSPQDTIPPDSLTMRDNPFDTVVDPARKALLSQVAIVSLEEDTSIPTLLNEGARQSAIVRRVILPRNPRIAGDELYELDSMDMIVVVAEETRQLSKDMLRWINLLKQLRIPMLVLLPNAPVKRREKDKIAQISQSIGLPIVAVTADKLEESRHEFVITTMRIAPAMGLALAAHMAHFRLPLMRSLLENALYDSLNLEENDDLALVQTHLSHQICAAYGRNGHQFETHKPALEILLQTTNHYITRFVERLPLRNPERRMRFTSALSTLFVGYATAIHVGETPPSFRKELLPKMWRLYRESGKAVLK